MKYNEKYGRWFTKGGLVYRYDSKQGKLVLCKQSDNSCLYKICLSSKGKPFLVHRAVYETFIGEIPTKFEIDHINTIRDDNRLENLRAVTHKENSNNQLTRQHRMKPHSDSEFGKKYFEHFGYSKTENKKQYWYEQTWYRRHNNKCSWE